MEEERSCYYQAMVGVLPNCDHQCDKCGFNLNERILDRFKDVAELPNDIEERGNKQ